MPEVRRVTVVTDPVMTRLGYVDRIIDVLQRRAERVALQIIDDVEPEPSVVTVDRGAELMRAFQPDTIVALGGGSAMDAAKVMWLRYEHPEVVFADMREKFSDIRKRAFRFPTLRERARLVCVPTTSGMAFGNAFLGIVHAMSHTLGATFHVAHGRTSALLLSHVIRYNGTVPAKLSGWPKYEDYRAPERFQEIVRTLGLPAGTADKGVESLAAAVERLRDAVRIERSLKEIGVDERTFLDALPQQAINAYEDQCASANPRMPMLDDMQELMRAAYYGRRDGDAEQAA
ncbi:iron-containing alcohol dehydrogenase [Planobispora rosea]|uniref:iron-containing alcohol dehydrogenase n=1 Tax=Planobispora rosea TaxID=35762 RepID=UPI00083AD7D4|nr:iron-containing alcohol dehydrogenase [Planobispora rosea]